MTKLRKHLGDKVIAMNENNLNQWIQSNLPELPPDDVVQKVTPWRKFIYYIIAGLILNTVTFSYYNLQYILPFVGSILLVNGFQALRQENKFFKMGWIFSVLCLVGMTVAIILNASLYD